MSDAIRYDEFRFERWFSDMNAVGGRRRRIAYYITNEAFDEPHGWRLVDQGTGVLKTARDLGVGNNDFRVFDADWRPSPWALSV
jgi:hypothetical protein